MADRRAEMGGIAQVAFLDDGGAAAAPVDPATPKEGWADYLLGAPSKEEQEIDEEEISGERPASYTGAAMAGLASDEQEKMRLFAARMYPNEPLEQATQRFQYVGGRLAHRGDDNELYWVLPGTARKLLEALPKQSALVAGGIAGILTAPSLMSIPAAAAAGGTAEYGRQKLGDVVFPEGVSTGEVNPWGVATTAVQEGGGQAVGLGMGRLMQPRTAPDIQFHDPRATESAYRRAEHPLRGAPGEVATEITPGQATGLKSIAVKEKRLAQKVATANEMQAMAERQDNAVLQNWSTFLDTLSDVRSVDEAGDMARKAATQAIDAAKKVRSDAASPHYEQAFSERTKVDTSDTLELLEQWATKGSDTGLGKAAEQLKKALTKRVKFTNPDGSEAWVRVPKDDLEELDIVKKFELDRMIRTRMAGDTPLDSTMVRRLQELKQGNDAEGIRGLVPTMKEASPAYKAGMEIYEEGSPEVDRILGTAIKNIAELKDPQLMRAATNLLSPGRVTHTGVTAARNLIEKQSPDAWKAIKRVYLQQTAHKVLKTVQGGGEVINPAGKLHKAFVGDVDTILNLRAAMEPREWARFRQLMGHYKDLSKRAVERSDTEWNRLESEAERKAATGTVARIIGNLNPAELVRSAREWLVERRMDKQALKMLDIVTSGDREALKAIEALRQFGKDDWRRYAVLGHLVTKFGEYGGKAAWDYLEEE